jgi:hypothetical protein
MGEPLLRSLGANLWILDRPLRVLGLEIGARMTVCRLADRSLWLHSPVEIDAEARAELRALGPVGHVVAPSKVHHFFVAAARQSFPEARFFAAPGLPEKKPKLAFDEVLSDDAPEAWAGQIDQVLLRGAPYLNEVVFRHRESRTLIFTDGVFNMGDGGTLPTRLWLRAMGARNRFGPHRMLRRFVRDRAAARASMDRILSWDFDRIVMSHGRVLQEKGPRVLRDAWRWLDDARAHPGP